MAPNSLDLGRAVSLRRYPVKSMQGEELNAVELTERGVLGDRAHAVVDARENKVASAKNPLKWPGLFSFRARFITEPKRGQPQGPVLLTLPDGRTIASHDPAVNEVVSTALGRPVRLDSAAPARPELEEYWLDIDGLAHRETVTVEAMPEQMFFDCAVLHVLTTATLDRLRQLNPTSRFEPRRFRPNLIVRTDGPAGFVENEWIGRTLAIGDAVLIEVNQPCGRCVMTTLEQFDLPKDPDVLRTAARHNAAAVGVYARVLQGGVVRQGDRVRLS